MVWEETAQGAGVKDEDLRASLTWANWAAQLISHPGEITLTILYAGDHSESIICRFPLIEMKCWLFIAAETCNFKGFNFDDCELNFFACVRRTTEAKQNT